MTAEERETLIRSAPDPDQFATDGLEEAPKELRGTAAGHLKQLLKIAIPSYCSGNFWLLGFAMLLLLGVAVLSICNGILSRLFMNSLDPQNPSALFDFIRVCILAVIFSTAFTTLYTIANFLNQKFSINWREKLVAEAHHRYFKDRAYYRLQNGRDTVDNPDQRLTTDATTVTTLFCQILLGSPTRDGVWYNAVSVAASSVMIFQSASWVALAVAVVWFLIGFFLNRHLMRPIVALAYNQNAMEGNFRFSHVRVRTYAESIAFYKGESREQVIIDEGLDDVVSNFHQLILARVPLNFANFFTSNFGACIAFVIPGLAIFLLKRNLGPGDVVELSQYISQLLTGLSQILTYGQDFSTLLGGSSRVGELFDKFDDIETGCDISNPSSRPLDRMIITQEMTLEDETSQGNHSQLATRHRSASILTRRRVFEATQYIDAPDRITTQNVLLHTPQGQPLVWDLNVNIREKEHIVICGASGAGKSSVARVIAGLWRDCGGVVARPPRIGRDGLFFVPQRPYIVTGSLRDQLCYPFRSDEIRHADHTILSVLDLVNLEHLPSRVGGLDMIANWDDMLSIGEQQRLGFARLFFHRPRFAILDESTASLDVPLEKALYEYAKEMTTVISVAHRPSAVWFHDYVMKVDKVNRSARVIPISEVTSIESLYDVD